MVSGLKVGDPSDINTFVGPIVNKAQYEKVKGYIGIGVNEGARIIAGGTATPDGEGLEKGYYIKPTLFVDVNNDMRIAREEIFGPVIVAIPHVDEADAVDIANDSPFGLSGSVYTQDIERGLNVARQIHTGTFSINGAQADYELPFGGYKESGLGREFGVSGLREYIQEKAIVL